MVLLSDQLISDVSYPLGLVLLVSSVPSVPPCLLTSELLPWLMFQECCFVIGSVSYRGFVYRGTATTLSCHVSQLHQAVPTALHVHHHQMPSNKRSQQCTAGVHICFQHYTYHVKVR